MNAAFFDAVRSPLFGDSLTQGQVDGCEAVIHEGLRRGTRRNDLSYILATVSWETVRTMQPVREAYWLSEDWRREHLRYYPYYGRGLIQTTWEDNYRRLAIALGLPEDFFLKDPDKLLEWEYALPALFVGMETGLYTGKDLDDYIDDLDESDDEDLREYIASRRIVNGTDKAREIGKMALKFEGALTLAGYPLAPKAAPVPAPPPDRAKPRIPTGIILALFVLAALAAAFFFLRIF
jgi:hypothetical protein